MEKEGKGKSEDKRDGESADLLPRSAPPASTASQVLQMTGHCDETRHS